MSVTVVIPTHDRLALLHRVLAGLSTQGGDFEVVVVSDGSTDGTAEYLRGDATPVPVIAIVQANKGPAAARNAGIEHAHGDLVVFLDDDVVPGSGWLKAHVDAHRRLGADRVVVGPMLDAPDHVYSPWVAWEQAMLARQYRAMERTIPAISSAVLHRQCIRAS